MWKVLEERLVLKKKRSHGFVSNVLDILISLLDHFSFQHCALGRLIH